MMKDAQDAPLLTILFPCSLNRLAGTLLFCSREAEGVANQTNEPVDERDRTGCLEDPEA